jgi:hypothetical protein
VKVTYLIKCRGDERNISSLEEAAKLVKAFLAVGDGHVFVVADSDEAKQLIRSLSPEQKQGLVPMRDGAMAVLNADYAMRVVSTWTRLTGNPFESWGDGLKELNASYSFLEGVFTPGSATSLCVTERKAQEYYWLKESLVNGFIPNQFFDFGGQIDAQINQIWAKSGLRPASRQDA